MQNQNTVIRATRSVIEHRLLTALENDESKVACLFTKQDLEDMIAALCGYEIGEKIGVVISTESYSKRREDLADGMKQLLHEAFPAKEDAK